MLTHIAGSGPAVSSPHVEVALDEAALRAVLLGSLPPLERAGRATITGDAAKITELLGHIAPRTRTSPSSLPDSTGHRARTSTGGCAPAGGHGCVWAGETPMATETPPPTRRIARRKGIWG
ncbi:hypothetical protein, partial [Streptomyces sp. NPDC058548]|uniref:hypothetical protein n=1 Tax=Streptomyces sp. NPDC058548 TaxID=3346545 RepID=UPI003661C07F